MGFSFRKASTLLLALLVLATTLAVGQGIVTGSISGMVQDQQKAVVSGATIKATEISTNREFSAVANEVGLFSLRSLPIGTYNILIQAQGFQKVQIRGVAVQAGEDTALGTQSLAIGGMAETVEVEGSAPLVESTTSQISASFDAKKLTDLPISNSFDSLALYIPGVAPTGSANFSNTNGAGFASNGQRGRSNNFQIDGQANNDNSVGGPSIFFGNQDAIAEMQIVTHYSAEYGRNMGSVVNYITKSGTNQFHGTGYWFNQNSLFDSMDNSEKSPLLGYCTPGQNAATDNCTDPKKARMNDNRFGGTVGGPIKKDKLWFFSSTNFEMQRFGSLVADSSPYLTPTSNGIAAIAANFPNSPAAAALQSIGPLGAKVGTVQFYDTTNVNVNGVPVEVGRVRRLFAPLFNDYEATGRVDYQISEKDRFFARYVFQRQRNDYESAVLANGAIMNVPGQDQQVGLDYTHTFTANLLDQLRFSYSRAGFGWEGGAFSSCTTSTPELCPTNISFTSPTDLSFGLATNLPQSRLINNTQWQDNASWQKGRHTIKFGGEYDRQRSPDVFLPRGNGQFVFSSLASLINNTPTRTYLTAGSWNLNFKEQDAATYLQDDFRVASNLTLNLGLRWEFYQQAINMLHDLTVARESNPSTAFWDTTLPLSQRTVPSIPQDTNNFSPVVGFAWTPQVLPQLFGNGKTVVRGGFRIGYDPSFYNMFLNIYSSAPVVNAAQIASRPGLPAGTSFNGAAINTAYDSLIPLGVNPGTRTETTVPTNFRNPYSEQWNFGVERELNSKMAVEARYVGNHSIGLFQDLNGNVAVQPFISSGFGNLVPAGVTPCTNTTQPGYSGGLGYANCSLSRVTEFANTAWSKYNALQTRYTVRNWHNITVDTSYTFSKTMDNASEVYSTLTGGSTLAFAQNPFNTDLGERSLSGIDYPHIFTIAFMYDIPMYKNQQGLVGKLLGGWETSIMHRYNSGQPWTPVQYRAGGLCDAGATMSGTYDACRPILMNSSAPLNSVGYYNASGQLFDYATDSPITSAHWVINDANAAAVYGTPFAGVRRNSVRGDSINNTNLAFFKNTKLTERLNLQFQAIAYNVLNRQFRGVPDTIVNDAGDPLNGGSFGNTYYNSTGGDTTNATGTGSGIRRLQFGLKMIF